MLEIRPNCELCDKDLPPDSMDACICTYECTFCSDCVSSVLQNVCPNCAGGFVLRPIRPARTHREGTGLEHQPASTKRIHTPYSREDITEFVSKVSLILPQDR